MKRIMLSLIVCVLLILMTGCNAVAGFGQDLSDSATWLDNKITDGFQSTPY